MAFSFKAWLKNAYIEGYKRNEFSAEFIADRCADQIDCGRFVDADAEEIYNAIEAYDAQKAMEQTPETVETAGMGA